MQSSPPERAWKRPASPTDSQYSVDLAALDLDSRSGRTTPLPEQHIDRVRSEDMDGPSDFTLNMEKWMRGGGTVGRGTARGMKKGLESLREARDEGVQTNGSLLETPHKRQDEEQSASHHTPTNSPPFDSVFDSNSGYQQRVGDVSEWNPYTDGDESTPEAPPHKHFLQPTVEDYYSELTPARLPAVKRTKSVSSRTQVGAEEPMPGKEQSSSPGRPSSETLSPVRSPARSPVRSPTRSPVLQRSAPRHFSSQSTKTEFEKQMEDLRAKCKQLELLNNALGQAVDEERRMRAEERKLHERSVAEAERRERDIIEMKDQAYLQRDDYRKDLVELKAKVETHERERDENRQGAELMRQKYGEDIRKVSEDAQRQKVEQAANIRELEQDLELARRSRDEAEEAEKVAREELDRHQPQLEKDDDHDDEDDLDKMQSDLTQIEDPADRVHDLEDELRDARSQIEKLSQAKKEAEDERLQARYELAKMQQVENEEMSRITADHRRAVAMAEDLQAQLKKLREQLQSQQMAHNAEIGRAREEASSKQPTTHSSSDLADLRLELESKQEMHNTTLLERDALRDDLETQHSRVNAAILERDEAQDALSSLQTQLDELKQTLADRDAVNADLDAKVSGAIAKREAYWRGRLEAAKREREVMVKALLRQWGREEVGPAAEEWDGEGRQGYEYRFVTEKKRRSVGAGADMRAGG